MALPSHCDVLVVGGGNAGFCAAISAAQSGAQKVFIMTNARKNGPGGIRTSLQGPSGPSMAVSKISSRS
ncbi:hypothetical protein BDV29DRAFT_168533 [Aspergillus leporis]|uniref:FAD-dependent oxidoreductase 2 FAD binding domain-containing protein n=1 Tax=Aspergillus leporis TaxID=41062 RepID=A0A5N5X8Z0_9EURO|nr:hypothetical protein BDV29DRAFT_168533 [Aspergillus leporis]